jgi:hypothetical protein
MNVLSALEFRSRVLCQDIRTEQNGKLILIGVYPGGIVFHTFPSVNTFAFYIEADTVAAAKGVLHVRIRVNDRHVAQMGIGIDVYAGGQLVIPSPQLQLEFPAPGSLVLEMSDDEENWHPLITRTTELGDVPGFTPIANERPFEQFPLSARDSTSRIEPSRQRGRKKK